MSHCHCHCFCRCHSQCQCQCQCHCHCQCQCQCHCNFGRTNRAITLPPIFVFISENPVESDLHLYHLRSVRSNWLHPIHARLHYTQGWGARSRLWISIAKTKNLNRDSVIKSIILIYFWAIFFEILAILIHNLDRALSYTTHYCTTHSHFPMQGHVHARTHTHAYPSVSLVCVTMYHTGRDAAPWYHRHGY